MWQLYFLKLSSERISKYFKYSVYPDQYMHNRIFP